MRIAASRLLRSCRAVAVDARNNAGTGHAALCELNYTPDRDGKIDVSKAVKVAECFEVSKPLWASLVARGSLDRAFITSVPHASFALRAYLPEARAEDWALSVAGQRVQVIRRDEEDGGRLEFGTEIVSSADNSLAALLGASPGASTSVSVALDLAADCFPEFMASDAAKARLAALIPSWGRRLDDDAALLGRVRAQSHAALGLDAP